MRPNIRQHSFNCCWSTNSSIFSVRWKNTQDSLMREPNLIVSTRCRTRSSSQTPAKWVTTSTAVNHIHWHLFNGRTGRQASFGHQRAVQTGVNGSCEGVGVSGEPTAGTWHGGLTNVGARTSITRGTRHDRRPQEGPRQPVVEGVKETLRETLPRLNSWRNEKDVFTTRSLDANTDFFFFFTFSLQGQFPASSFPSPVSTRWCDRHYSHSGPNRKTVRLLADCCSETKTRSGKLEFSKLLL